MLTVLLALLCACLALALWQFCRQLDAWADFLEQTPAGSNARLTTSLRGRDFVRLVKAVNARLDAARAHAVEAERSGRELQNTIAAVSHDIRTPLTGAGGYLELAQDCDDPALRQDYLAVVQRRLADLETLLDELFLYTRLTAADAPPPDCRPVAVYPVLCEALAALYPRLRQAGIEPELDFADETLRWNAAPEALGRILRNLILNAAQHGGGDLRILCRGQALVFVNRVADPRAVDAARLFDLFWRGDAARHTGGTGLGLAIVRQLTEGMGGRVDAEMQDDRLCIRLWLPS